MKEIVFFILPVGIFLSVCLLSGVVMFQQFAIYIQKKSINFEIYSYKISISISSLISLYSLVRFSFTLFELKNFNDENADYLNPPNFRNSYLKKIRLQRNFWILLLCTIIWIFFIRFTYLLGYYRGCVKKINDEFEKNLEAKRDSQGIQKKLSQTSLTTENKTTNENILDDLNKDKKGNTIRKRH
ncbi:conserved Plasmodium protein, unknown function [Plasmodium berghei]|uniref:Uncharacterized protein n=2 Tax=Plasmodium berghei TaxID=5821 RepID=A0A509AL49_PLABA|nr:conserved Plasmodium protein, unknown function [Plasmodium berghei ANKA]CXI51472.1 conserved Plasmodium protein, unknown function [Plasmodium berghei]SCL94451.1 conserved Plasmodium protein, unknown function [Plasmodium berghei]SCM16025.1 conserved Plasmodium protein, unknown function [Plasmodium berghei]SCM17821.1 conserved Plasmodium protein, unknown function [Plasmodium berghei]SCN26085.1 conserved Plasmodium protein, unknown function [Plasmodium berghei]|eukprot:XP_034421950.1 conserved Plasmodium protein, unknown function [Plasmodium berghei ANKA]